LNDILARTTRVLAGSFDTVDDVLDFSRLFFRDDNVVYKLFEFGTGYITYQATVFDRNPGDGTGDDDLGVVPLLAPAALLLTGLGALGWLRRRRLQEQGI